MMLGSTALTFTPSPFSSADSDCVRARTAALVAP